MKNIFCLILVLSALTSSTFSNNDRRIIVAQDGSGDHKTISEAVAALPVFNYGRMIVYVKNGIYNEKIRIEQDYITLEGESRDSTILQFSQLREEWNKNPDNIGPAVINIFGDDFIIKNITVKNTQPEIGPHAFAIYGICTRTIILNCNVISKGGDTVSLWDYKNGMYYHADCYFEGAVDFVCPRGWCYIKNSKFYEVKKTAALWHAGGFEKSQKFVLENCRFDGVEGFELARHHYDAQFYFVDCSFSAQMSTKKIYRVTYPGEPEKERPFFWGERYYFYNSSREGGSPEWMNNNISSAEGSLSPENVTAAWTFDNKWNPESEEEPYITDYAIDSNKLILTFSEPVTITGKPELISSSGTKFAFFSGGENNVVEFEAREKIFEKDIKDLKITNGEIFASGACVRKLNANPNI